MGLEALGYEVASYGHNQWNGVAIVCRVGSRTSSAASTRCPSWGDPVAAEARAIGATCNGVRVWSLYVPNGRKPDDPHYHYKLAWLEALRDAAAGWLAERPGAAGRPGRRLEHRAAGRGRLRHRAVREEHARDSAGAGGVPGGGGRRVRDVVRPHQPGPEVYTYWDYYRQRFERNRGMRIDFVLGSPALATRVTGARDRPRRAGRHRRQRPRPGDRRPRRLSR